MSKFPFPDDAAPRTRVFATEVIRRLEDIERSNVSRDSQSALSDRAVAATLDALSRQVSTLTATTTALAAQQGQITAAQASITAAQIAITNQQNQIIATQKAIPITRASAGTVSPTLANAAAWVAKAGVAITVPAGKTSATVTMVGSVALLDTTTGGVAAPFDTRFTIFGVPYPRANGVPATKDPGASRVNNVVTVAGSATISVTPGSTLQVNIEVYSAHTTAFATASISNFATLSATATFS